MIEHIPPGVRELLLEVVQSPSSTAFADLLLALKNLPASVVLQCRLNLLLPLITLFGKFPDSSGREECSDVIHFLLATPSSREKLPSFVFRKVFVSLTAAFHPLERDLKVLLLSEHLSISILSGIETLLNGLDSRECFYDDIKKGESEPPMKLVLAQGIYVIVQTLRTTANRKVKLQCMKTLRAFLSNESEDERLATLMGEFVPGVLSAALAILIGDCKETRLVLTEALELWCLWTCLIMQDSVFHILKKSIEWKENMKVQVRAQVEKISAVLLGLNTHHEVKLALIKWSANIFGACSLSLQTCRPALLRTLLALSVDTPFPQVSQEAYVLLTSSAVFSPDDPETRERELSTVLVDVISHITRSKAETDANSTLLLLYQVEAVMNLLSNTFPPTLIQKISPALVAVIRVRELDPFEDEMDLKGGPALSNLPTHLIKDASRDYVPRVINIARILSNRCDPYAVTDHFGEAIISTGNIDEAPSAIWVFNRVLDALDPIGKEEVLQSSLDMLGRLSESDWESSSFSTLLVEGIGIAVRKLGIQPPLSRCIHLDHPHPLVRWTAQQMVSDSQTLAQLAAQLSSLRLSRGCLSSAASLKGIVHLCDEEPLRQFGKSILEGLTWINIESDDRVVQFLELCTAFASRVQIVHHEESSVIRGGAKSSKVGAVTAYVECFLSGLREESVEEQETEGENLWEEDHPHTQMAEAVRADEEARTAPDHVKACARICHSAASVCHRRRDDVALSALTTIRECLYVMKNFDDEVLPQVHFLWTPLVDAFHRERSLAVRVVAVSVLALISELAGHFIQTRFTKDLLNSLVCLVQQLSTPSTSSKGGTGISAQGVRTWPNPLVYKFQKETLSSLAKILLSIRNFSVRDIRILFASVLPLLSNPEEATEIREIAVRLMEALLTLNAGCCFLLLKDAREVRSNPQLELASSSYTLTRNRLEREVVDFIVNSV